MRNLILVEKAGYQIFSIFPPIFTFTPHLTLKWQILIVVQWLKLE